MFCPELSYQFGRQVLDLKIIKIRRKKMGDGFMGMGNILNQIADGSYVDKYYFWMTIFSDGSVPKQLDPIKQAGGTINFPLVWFRRELGHDRIFGNYEAANPVKLGHEILMASEERKIVVAKNADLNTGYLDDLHKKGEHFDAIVNFSVRSPNGSERFSDMLSLKRAKIRRITRQKILTNKIAEYLHITFRHSTETFAD